MKVLGISPLDKDATVSLVEDGKVLFAAGEERFSRKKQQPGFPQKAIEAALAYCGVAASEIDQVVYPFLSAAQERKHCEANFAEEGSLLGSIPSIDTMSLIRAAEAKIKPREGAIYGLKHPDQKVEKSALHDLFYRYAGTSKMISRHGSKRWMDSANASFAHWESDLNQGLQRYGWDDKLKYYDHHLTHAANAFYSSGYERALIVTLDGYGTGLAGSVSIGEEGRIRRLQGVNFPHSLGTMYEHVTSSLEFKPSRHEGKIVGLASYGDPSLLSEVLLSRISREPGSFRMLGANNVYLSRYLASKFPKIDVAAAYQHVLEVVATDFIRHWVKETGIDTVVLSGGVTANVKLNQRIFEIEGVNRIFVYPNMGDGGCGTGAALFLTRENSAPETINNVYYGPDYSESEIRTAIQGLDYSKPEHLARDVAALINQGHVVARFDGRMEYGPRALGNRSIMYHAREPEVNQWLNKRLGRTEFMPFAPVTLFECRDQCYHNMKGAEHSAEFMTITFDCTEEMKRSCPAAVHVDGTARPQLIRREVNAGYYDIVDEYRKITGVPSLINTSFNMHEEPIVCSPQDAVRAFIDGGLDYLVIGPFLIKGSAQ